MFILFLAGGFATRLWPLTKDYPKPLLPIGKKSILEYSLKKALILKEQGIIDEIFISTNRAFEYIFKKWLRDRDYFQKINLIVEPTITEEEKFGAIRGINYDLDLIENRYGKDDIIILAGDNIFSFDLNDYIEFMLKKESPIVAVYELDDINKARHYGIVEIDKCFRVLNFVEKPQVPKTNLAATAIYGIPKNYIDYYRRYLDEGENPDAPGFFFQWLVARTKVYAYVFRGYWFDIGTIDGYFDALRTLMSKTYIDDSAEVEGKIVEPIVVMSNSRVDADSEIGPYVILSSNVRVENAQLSYAVILENSTIANSHIKESLIGRNVFLRNGKLTQSMIGSFSRIFFRN